MTPARAPPTTFAGCAASRADVVPATDHSPERYSRATDAYIAEASRLYALPEVAHPRDHQGRRATTIRTRRLVRR